MNIRARMIAGFVATSLFTLSAQSIAASPKPDHDEPAVSRTVHFGDLDLATQKGRKTLEGRVRVAASQVCREIAPTTTGRYANLKCNSSLTEQTMAKVFANDGTLLARYKQIAVQTVADARTP